MPSRRLRVHRTAILGLLFLVAMAMQGCSGMVWLGAVGIDRTRSSDIEFQSFENPWVVPPQERQHLRVGEVHSGDAVRRRSGDG